MSSASASASEGYGFLRVDEKGAREYTQNINKEMQRIFARDPKISLRDMLGKLNDAKCFSGVAGAEKFEERQIAAMADNQEIRNAFNKIPKTRLQKALHATGEGLKKAGEVLVAIGKCALIIGLYAVAIVAAITIGSVIGREANSPILGSLVGWRLARSAVKDVDGLASDMAGVGRKSPSKSSTFDKVLIEKAKEIGRASSRAKAVDRNDSLGLSSAQRPSSKGERWR